MVLAVCAARDDNRLCSALFITRACATFPLHATSQKNCRHFFLDRNAPGRRRAGAGGRVVRQQDQENLRADADPDAAETSQELDRAEEKRGRGKIAYAKAIGHSGEISVALFFEEEKGFREVPLPRRKPEPSASASPKKKKNLHRRPHQILRRALLQKKKHKPSPSPTPTPAESPTPSSSPTATPGASETPSATPSPSPSAKKKGAPATIAAKEHIGL